MKNAIFKIGNTLEKFISTLNSPGKSLGENDRWYLTDFSVSASQAEIDQSSDEGSNCGRSPQNKRSRNAVNVDDCRASKDVFYKDINLLVRYAEKQDQSGKVTSAVNDLAIFEETNKRKSEEELGPAISSQLTEKYWSEESKNPVVVDKTLGGLKILENCSGLCVPILNEVVAKNRKNMSFHKRADKSLSDIQKGLILQSLK